MLQLTPLLPHLLGENHQEGSIGCSHGGTNEVVTEMARVKQKATTVGVVDAATGKLWYLAE